MGGALPNLDNISLVHHPPLPTAGLDVQYEPTKKQFANEPEGLRHFRDHRWKALGKENLDLLCIFFSDHFFDLLFFKTSQSMAPTKIYTADLDSPRRII